MIRFNYILYIFLAVALFSCEDQLRDLNTNPEILETTQPEYLFAGATENFMSRERVHLLGRYSGVMTFMQYLVPSGGGTPGTYIAQNKKEGAGPQMNFLWDDYYTLTGNDLRTLMQLIDKRGERQESYLGLRAISQLLEIQQAWICVDLYGAMPYHEALKAISEGGTQKPKYDFIWELYKEFDQIVKEQVSILENLEEKPQTDISKYDFFYKGDLNKWAKFGNSLRVKMALRYEHRDPDFLKQVVNEVTQTQSKVMENNEDGCWYHHPKDFNTNIDDINSIRTRYVTTEAFVNTLKFTGDPRLHIMVKKNHFQEGIQEYDDMMKNAPDTLEKYNPDNERYFGMPASPYAVNEGKTEYGNRITGSVEATWKEGDNDISRSVHLISLLQGRYFVKNGGYKNGEYDPLETWVDDQSIKMRTCVLSYADLCFTMAEIAEKYGLNQMGSPGEWYRKGIEASIGMYVTMAEETFVPKEEIEACKAKTAEYLNSPLAQYTGSQQEKLEKIYTQAWINYLKHPEEAYAMWKRTGYPAFREWKPGEEVKTGYLDKLFGASSKEETSLLLIPRRAGIPQRDENYANWDAAVKGQMEKDPAYGEIPNDCRGRIWWDNAGVTK